MLCDGPQLVGYAMTVQDGELTDLLRLGVAPNYQGRGYGKQLLMKILMDNKNLILCVNPDNKVALKLYLGCGLKIVGRLLVGADAWVMST